MLKIFVIWLYVKSRSASSEAWGKFASTGINKGEPKFLCSSRMHSNKTHIASKAYKKVPVFHCDNEILKTSKIVFSVLAWYDDMSKNIM